MMFARLNQINAEITDIERLISSKNETIISALKKGTDTLDEEKQVVLLKKALQLKDGARRKLMSELRILAGAAPNSRGGTARGAKGHYQAWS